MKEQGKDDENFFSSFVKVYKTLLNTEKI